MTKTTTTVYDRVRIAEEWKARAEAQGIKLGRLPVTHDKLADRIRALAQEANDEKVRHEIKARQAGSRAEVLQALADEVTAELPDVLRALRTIEAGGGPPSPDPEPAPTGGEL